MIGNRRFYIVGIANQGSGDTTAPTLTIELASITGNVASMRITASEIVTGFAVGDITISGGSLASFATADNIIFTVDWTLAVGANTMDINAGVCTDAAGNNNVAATQYAITSPILLQDAFTDTDATALALHTPTIGGPWVAANGTWVITSNQATETDAGSVIYFAVSETGDADVTLSGVLALTTGNSYSAGFALRYQDVNNAWMISIARVSGATPVLQIIERNGGVNTTRATTTLTGISLPSSPTVQIIANGTSISVSVTGGYTASYESATFNQTKTKHGLQTFRSGSYLLIPHDSIQVLSGVA